MRVRTYRTDLTNRSRQLRKQQTDAEKWLWYHIRNRRLQNIKFQRQYAIGVYVVDFIAREYKTIIELDGGQHNEDNSKEYDRIRTKCLESEGYILLRFWNNEVLKKYKRSFRENFRLNILSS